MTLSRLVTATLGMRIRRDSLLTHQFPRLAGSRYSFTICNECTVTDSQLGLSTLLCLCLEPQTNFVHVHQFVRVDCDPVLKLYLQPIKPSQIAQDTRSTSPSLSPHHPKYSSPSHHAPLYASSAPQLTTQHTYLACMASPPCAPSHTPAQ